MAPSFKRCDCGSAVVKLRPDKGTLDRYLWQTIEIGEDVMLIGSRPEFVFDAVIGHAFQPGENEGTAKLVEALVLHRCPRRK